MAAQLFWENPGKEVLNYADLTLLIGLIAKYGIKAIVSQCKYSCEAMGDISKADFLGEILD